MPRWGTPEWTAVPLVAPSTGAPPRAPAFLERFPTPGAVNVPAATPIRVIAFDPDIDLEPTTYRVTINNTLAYDGNTDTIHPDYRGVATTFSRRRIVELAPKTPFAPGTLVRVDVEVSDALAAHSTSTWSFTVERDTTCYDGAGILPPEQWVLEPMLDLLELEPLRRYLLEIVLRAEVVPGEVSRRAIAARALYQMAFDTEVSSVLNPYFFPDAPALAVPVCQKRSTLEIAQLLEGYEGRITRAIQQLTDRNVLPRTYRTALADYADSMLYTYRVSAACVLVFLGRAAEVAARTAPTPGSSGFTNGLGGPLPLQLGG